MRPALAVGALVALAVLAARPPSSVADDAAAAAGASVTLRVPRPTAFVGEGVPVTVRVTLPTGRGPADLVPRLRPRMDVPLHVEVPALRGTPLGTWLAPEPVAGPVVTLAVNDDVVAARPVEGGYEVTRRLRVERAGDGALAAPTLRLTVATRFHDDLLLGRVPEDPRDVVVVGPPCPLRVVPLPPEAVGPDGPLPVGRFAAVARLAPAPADATSLEVTVDVTGDGDLARLPGPRLAPDAGFHLLGAREARAPAGRRFVVDLAPTRPDVRDVPPLRWRVFDPTPPGAVTEVATAAIPWRGTAGPGPTPSAGRGAGGGRPPLWTAGAGLAVVAAVVLARRRRTRARRAAEAAAAPLEAAAAAFRATTRDDVAARGARFLDVLAARLGVAPAAVVAADLGARLVAAGVDAPLAARAAAAAEAFVAARYGGTLPAATADDAEACVEALREAR